jgi:hypothetical protein
VLLVSISAITDDLATITGAMLGSDPHDPRAPDRLITAILDLSPDFSQVQQDFPQRGLFLKEIGYH